MNAAPLPPLPRSYDDERTLLVKVFGKDRPGITAGLFSTLGDFGVDVIDIEQMVTRGRTRFAKRLTARLSGSENGCGPGYSPLDWDTPARHL